MLYNDKQIKIGAALPFKLVLTAAYLLFYSLYLIELFAVFTNVSIIIIQQYYFITCQSCADSATIHSAVTGAGLIHYFIKA